MFRRMTIGIILCLSFLTVTGQLHADLPTYTTNPFAFAVAEPIFWGTFFACDLNGDSLPDYTYRSETKLYAYNHDGSLLWQTALAYPGPAINNYGTKHGVADIDGDGQVEIAALDNSGNIYIFNGTTGGVEKTLPLPSLGANQIACHIQIVNLRGAGDRDAIIQTCDIAPESHGWNENAMGYYINRSLIAMNLENGNVLWRVDQDADPANGFYEGYWGPAHGPFFAADVDEDGKDEVIGGNLIEENGSVKDLGYPQTWLDSDIPSSYIDHLDGIAVGDIRPDLPGLEWIITDEDNLGFTHYNTTLMSTNGIIWSNELPSFLPEAREPQHTAAGNFDPAKPFAEIWVRSRLGGQDPIKFYRPYDSQWPWIYDNQGNLFPRETTYRMVERLPIGFNSDPTDGNKLGIEITWTIDWNGSQKEYIAGKARFVDGHIGIFDVWKASYIYKIDTVWTTIHRRPNIKTQMLYVADVEGDSREEMIVYDATDGRIRIYANSKPNPNQPKPYKWDDPLYRRLKQNWNFYSPGSYTCSDYPLMSNVQITNITASGATISWTTDEPSTSQIGFGTTNRLGHFSHEDAQLTIQHSVVLDSLAKNTAYKIQTRSKNQYKKLGLSIIQDLSLLTLSSVQMQQISGSSQPQLTWQEIEEIPQFNVYRDTLAKFTPKTENRIAEKIQDGNTSLTGVQWTDVTTGPRTRFYRVTAASGIYEGDPSEAFGVYTYPIKTSNGTDFNLVGLPLETSGLSKASDLMARIPGCNSVARWDAASQGYEQYIPGVPSTNFNIQAGQAYYVNVTADTALSVAGKVSTFTYQLISTASSSFNQILSPLNRTDIQTASQLASDIPGCNSVARWDAAVQGYAAQYDPSVPGSDFPVKPGQPYLVNVTANTTWPAGGSPKVAVAFSTQKTSKSSQAPHLVWGNFDPSLSIRTFRAYFVEKPEEVLTETSSGCRLLENRWQVQCGNLKSGWWPDEILRIEFFGQDGEVLSRQDVVLSSNPSDSLNIHESKHETALPRKTALMPNYPNPFNPSTTISYALAEDANVHIQIFNARGQIVTTLVDRHESAGIHQTIWTGTDRAGIPVSGGVYFVSLSTGKHRYIQKILLLK